jgi:hypothetical protein
MVSEHRLLHNANTRCMSVVWIGSTPIAARSEDLSWLGYELIRVWDRGTEATVLVYSSLATDSDVKLSPSPWPIVEGH